MATPRSVVAVVLLAPVLLSGCSQKPLSRMDLYLGTAAQGERLIVPGQAELAAGPYEAGLVLINDTSAEGSAPALSDQTKAFLADQVRKRIEATVPIRIVKVLSLTDSTTQKSQHFLAQLARAQGLSHVLIALFSSEESEVPMMLPFGGDPEQGGGRPRALGFEAVNYALAELALLDSTNGQVMARSEGRAWTRLNRLNVPVKSNAYPVIHRSLRAAPIYPPEEQAKDVLRGIAGDEALEQAVYKMELAWPKS